MIDPKIKLQLLARAKYYDGLEDESSRRKAQLLRDQHPEAFNDDEAGVVEPTEQADREFGQPQDETGEEEDAEEDANEASPGHEEAERLQENALGNPNPANPQGAAPQTPGSTPLETASKTPEPTPPSPNKIPASPVAGGPAMQAPGGTPSGQPGGGAMSAGGAGGGAGAAISALANNGGQSEDGGGDDTGQERISRKDKLENELLKEIPEVKAVAAGVDAAFGKGTSDKLMQEAKKQVKWRLYLIIGGALFGLLVVFLIVFALMGASNNEANKIAHGSSSLQDTSPLSDKEWLSKLLTYAGNTDIISSQETQTISDLTTAITEIKADSKVDAETLGWVAILEPKVNSYLGTSADKKSDLGKDIMLGVNQIIYKYYPCRKVAADTPSFFNHGDSAADVADQAGLLTGKIKPVYGGDEIQIDYNICKLLLLLEEKKDEIGITSINIFAIGVDKPTDINSLHCSGHAVDIIPSDGSPSFDKTMDWIINNMSTLNSKGIYFQEIFGPNKNDWYGKGLRLTSTQVDDSWHDYIAIFDWGIHLGFKDKP